MRPLTLLIAQRLTWISYLVALGLVAYIYFAGVTALGLDIDDDNALRDNLAISKDFSVLLAGGQHHPTGRPVGHLVRQMAFAIWDNEPTHYHVLSVCIHVLVAFLLARLAFVMGMDPQASMLGGLLFMVNVGHFKAVHHIAALEYLLGGACVIIAQFFFVRWYRSKTWKWLLLFCFVLLVGLGSHIATVVVVPFALYWAWSQGLKIQEFVRCFLPAATVIILGTLFLLKPAAAPETTTARSVTYLATTDIVSIANSVVTMLLWFFSRLFTTAHFVPVVLWEIHTWEIYCGGLLMVISIWANCWRRNSSIAYGMVWSALALFPFAWQPEEVITHIPGPSRYLYIASAGSSLVLGQLIYSLGTWRREGLIVAIGISFTLLITSYSGLKKMEGLSFYTSGRHYVATGDLDVGKGQFHLALAQGADVLPLVDTYYRLCNLLLSTGDEFGPTLSQALHDLPEDDTIQALHYVTESLSLDTQARDASLAKLNAILASSNTFAPEERSSLRSMIATVYHNAAIGLYIHGQIERSITALQMALTWDPQRDNSKKQLAKMKLVKQGLRVDPAQQ